MGLKRFRARISIQKKSKMPFMPEYYRKISQSDSSGLPAYNNATNHSMQSQSALSLNNFTPNSNNDAPQTSGIRMDRTNQSGSSINDFKDSKNTSRANATSQVAGGSSKTYDFNATSKKKEASKADAINSGESSYMQPAESTVGKMLIVNELEI